MNCKIRQGISLGLALAAFGWAQTGGAQAVTRYVSPTGNNTFPYTSWGTAANAILTAVNAANTNDAGDTVLVTNGVYAEACAAFYISNVIVRSFNNDPVNKAPTNVVINIASGWPRNVVLAHSNAVLDGFMITNGASGAGGGVGGVSITRGGGTLRNCWVRNNYVAGSQVGGVYIKNIDTNGRGVITNCTISENGGGTACGGVTVGTNGFLQNCAVVSNYANGSASPGGVEIAGGWVENCLIQYNRVTHSAGCCGGVYLLSGTPQLINSAIQFNISSNYAGGVRVAYGCAGIVRGCLIANNTCMTNYGGGLYNSRGPMIRNCTIVSNQAANGGGINAYDMGGNFCYYGNNVVYGNVATDGTGTNFNLSSGVISGCRFTNNCMETTFALNSYGANNITNKSPLFRDTANGDFRLAGSSPCIDSGFNEEWMTTAVDLDGHPRIRNGTVDMGAYEAPVQGMIFYMR